MRLIPVLAVLSILLISSPAAVSAEPSEELWLPEETWYCYGNLMTLNYLYESTGLTIEWTIIGYLDGTPGEVQNHTGPNLLIDVRDYDIVHVTQAVTSIETGDTDSKSIEVFPVGLMPGETIVVRYMDGYNEISRDVLDKNKSVMLGNPFTYPPEDPSKTNYRFTGWYLDRECTQTFNPLTPILRDITVYAGWASTGTSGSTTVSGYVVTFNTAPGLTYKVVGTGERAISFTVSVMDGYRFDTDSIQASAGTTKISPVNGVYTLSGISRDTVIEITGDRLYNVSYDLSRMNISSEFLDRDSVSVSFSPVFGWSGVSLKVIMGGADVTSQYADGSSVEIDEMTGDVIIIAQADFPWIYIVIAAVLIAIAVAVFLVRGRAD